MIPENPVFYLVPYFFSIVFPLFLGIFVRLRNRALLGKTFSAMLFVEALWAAASLGEIVFPRLADKILFDDFQYFSVGLVAVLTLSFSFLYTGRWFRGGNRTFYLLMIFPVAAWIFAATGDIHGLHRIDARLDTAVPFGELTYSFGIWMLLFVTPLYAMSVVALERLLRYACLVRGSRRMGALFTGVGIFLPLIGTGLTIAAVRINGRQEASSLWLVAGDLLIALGIFRFRMASVLPVARQKILQNLRDPVLVIDKNGVIIDCNTASGNLVSGMPVRIKGRVLGDLFGPQFPCCDSGSESAGDIEFVLGSGSMAVDYSLKVFPVRQNEEVRILVFRDITVLKQAEQTLRLLSEDLERKVEERALELEAEVRRRRQNEEQILRMNAEIDDTRTEVMRTLADVVENRGKETAWHVARVSEYSRILASAAGYSAAEAIKLSNASTMHDIGKIRIPDAVLHITGSLQPEEIALMQSHTRAGAEILGNSDDPLLVAAARIALEHHEHWDGSGYPEGKAGFGISRDARIVAVADVFDSLAEPRSYRPGWNIDSIIEYFRLQRGKIFEPSLVDALFANLDMLLAVAEKYRRDDDGVLQDFGELPE